MTTPPREIRFEAENEGSIAFAPPPENVRVPYNPTLDSHESLSSSSTPTPQNTSEYPLNIRPSDGHWIK
eukprot:561940-Hanusia_phi.AAC.1